MKMKIENRILADGRYALLAVLIMANGWGKEKSDPPSATITERVSAKCECGIPTYQCAECRYELGVVKVDATLLKQPDGTGLVKTQIMARTQLSAVLPTTGEWRSTRPRRYISVPAPPA